MNRIEHEIASDIPVVHLNVMSSEGLRTAQRLGVRATPSIVVVDRRGAPMATFVGVPVPGRVIEAAYAAAN